MSHRVQDPSEPVASSTMYDQNSAVQYKSITNHKINEHKSKLNINHPNNSSSTHDYLIKSGKHHWKSKRKIMEGVIKLGFVSRVDRQ